MPQHKPKAHFKDSMDKRLTAFKITQDNWENDVTDQLKGIKDIYKGEKIMKKTCSHAKLKRYDKNGTANG